MYNTHYIFTECGFDWVPEYIDRTRLFNVSYDTGTGEIKLYVLGKNGTFLYKISRKGIFKQYDALAYGADPARLGGFLGRVFDYTQIVIDTFEDDTYYVHLDDAREQQYQYFIEAVCQTYGISATHFLATVNRINTLDIKTIRDCFMRNALSLVKIPFLANHCKLYAKPFLHGNGYALDDKAVGFLTRLYDCDRAGLDDKIQHLWISSEMFSGRIVVTTQYHGLVHTP